MDVLRLLVFTEAWEGLLPAQSSHDEPAGVLRPEPLQPASQVRLEHACPSCCQAEEKRSQWHLCRVFLPHISLVQSRSFLQVRRGAGWVKSPCQGCWVAQVMTAPASLSSSPLCPLQQVPAELLSRHWLTCSPFPACAARGCFGRGTWLQMALHLVSWR